MSEHGFETSQQLRNIFNQEVQRWKTETGGTLDSLAEKCGVSRSYLGHIGRYGRIPSKPVMLLLILNLEVKSPDRFLQAACSPCRWPFDPRAVICAREQESSGLLSVRLDLDGLADRMREIVRHEIKSQDIKSITEGGVLRLGVNTNDRWLVNSVKRKGALSFIEAFRELCRMLGLTLRCKIETVPLEYRSYGAAFAEGRIDIFGPTAAGPHSPIGIFTQPFANIGLSALCRKKESSFLDALEPPKTMNDLMAMPYAIAVVRDSSSHLFVNARLSREDTQLIICDSLEEAVERLTMASIRNSAHLLICNTPNAVTYQRERPNELVVRFADAKTLLDIQQTVFVVRPDLQELATLLDKSISYLIRTGSLRERFEVLLTDLPKGVVSVPQIEAKK